MLGVASAVLCDVYTFHSTSSNQVFVAAVQRLSAHIHIVSYFEALSKDAKASRMLGLCTVLFCVSAAANRHKNGT
jgi:hypothetical protein